MLTGKYMEPYLLSQVGARRKAEETWSPGYIPHPGCSLTHEGVWFAHASRLASHSVWPGEGNIASSWHLQERFGNLRLKALPRIHGKNFK